MTSVTLYGTRGSIAAPGPETERYGGNTSTVEVRGEDDTVLILDAGTGIRRLSTQLPENTRRVDIFLTHLHMDHIQGLGFFGALYNPGIDVHIWGPPNRTLGLEDRLSRYLSPPLFPVHLRDLPRVQCHVIPNNGIEVGPFTITSALVCHPNPTVGYRISDGTHSLAYIPDHEPALGLSNGKWHGPEWTSGYALAEGTDLLIHDAQYSDEEYARCVGWGHSAYRHTFDFAAMVGARKLVPFHHDPSHDDATLDRLLQQAIAQHNPSYAVAPGCEGSIFQLGDD